MTINDGGPAFPYVDPTHGTYGMSLRDWYAGQVLPVLMNEYNWVPESIAREAYQLADAMMRARAKTDGE